MAYAICAVLIVTFGRVALVSATSLATIGALLTVCGSVLLAYQISRFPPAAAPGQLDFTGLREFYARELRRQHDFHRIPALWLRSAFVLAGPFVIVFGTIATSLARPDRIGAGVLQLAVFVALATGAVAMNQRVVARYSGRLKGLERSRETP
jgi:hypothetical protein